VDRAVRVAPDERLSGGLVVRASILARLLGIRLLRLDADILLVPARVQEAADVELAGRFESGQPAGIETLVDPVQMNDTRGLRDAQRLLQRAARTLEESPPSRDRAIPQGRLGGADSGLAA
jgi:hypothetical protein